MTLSEWATSNHVPVQFVDENYAFVRRRGEKDPVRSLLSRLSDWVVAFEGKAGVWLRKKEA